jgi:tetratricopeptide (TPR) repeat protein
MANITQVGEGWTPDLNGRGESALLKEIALLEQVADRSAPVLVADDMQTMRLILAQSLRQAGFMNVERAADGEEALKLMQRHGCGMALVDWNMPRVDGLALLDRVRNDPDLKNLVFIMVTAETLDIKVIRAAEEKQDAYLTKPISPEKLARRLDLILERRLTTARSLLLEVQGRGDQAVDAFMAALQNRPGAYWPLFGLGGLLARLGRWDEAESCFQRLLEQDPTASAALLQLGRLRQAQGRLPEAREMYQTALRDSPRFFKAYDALAKAMLAEGDAAGALEVLSQAMARQGTENAGRQELMGRLQLELECYPEAESAFRKALKLKPLQHQVENHLQLGRALLGQDRHEEAAEALAHAAKEALTQRCDDARLQALVLAGTALARGGRLSEAEEMFGNIQDPEAWPGGEPPLEPALYHRKVGEAYLAAGMQAEAVRHFSSSLALADGGQAEIERLCLESGGDELAGRLQRVKEAVQQERAEDCARRGLELVAQGEFNEALAEYQRGLDLDPGSGRLFFNLGRLQSRLEQGANALTSMVSAAHTGLQRSDWELLVEVARFFASEGHLQQALSLLGKVQEHAPDYTPARELWQALNGSPLAGAEEEAEARRNGPRI